MSFDTSVLVRTPDSYMYWFNSMYTPFPDSWNDYDFGIEFNGHEYIQYSRDQYWDWDEYPISCPGPVCPPLQGPCQYDWSLLI